MAPGGGVLIRLNYRMRPHALEDSLGKTPTFQKCCDLAIEEVVPIPAALHLPPSPSRLIER